MGDKIILGRNLGNQATILYARGDFDGAMGLYKEEERICRERGDRNWLQGSLGNQAVILKARGDFDGAMGLYKEQERICREMGYKEGLARSLANQALLLRDMRRSRDGLRLAEEAYQLASSHGLTALAQQIKPILDRLRSQ